MFAPVLGVAEDPATGGASGPLGSYLVRHSLVTPEQARSILNLQGVKLGRPSWIHVSIESARSARSRACVSAARRCSSPKASWKWRTRGVLTEYDLHLFNEGTLHRAYEKLGAHRREVDGVSGVHFAVWAPNAEAA